AEGDRAPREGTRPTVWRAFTVPVARHLAFAERCTLIVGPVPTPGGRQRVRRTWRTVRERDFAEGDRAPREGTRPTVCEWLSRTCSHAVPRPRACSFAQPPWSWGTCICTAGRRDRLRWWLSCEPRDADHLSGARVRLHEGETQNRNRQLPGAIRIHL